MSLARAARFVKENRFGIRTTTRDRYFHPYQHIMLAFLFCTMFSNCHCSPVLTWGKAEWCHACAHAGAWHFVTSVCLSSLVRYDLIRRLEVGACPLRKHDVHSTMQIGIEFQELSGRNVSFSFFERPAHWSEYPLASFASKAAARQV